MSSWKIFIDNEGYVMRRSRRLTTCPVTKFRREWLLQKFTSIEIKSIPTKLQGKRCVLQFREVIDNKSELDRSYIIDSMINQLLLLERQIPLTDLESRRSIYRLNTDLFSLRETFKRNK